MKVNGMTIQERRDQLILLIDRLIGMTACDGSCGARAPVADIDALITAVRGEAYTRGCLDRAEAERAVTPSASEAP